MGHGLLGEGLDVTGPGDPGERPIGSSPMRGRHAEPGAGGRPASIVPRTEGGGGQTASGGGHAVPVRWRRTASLGGGQTETVQGRLNIGGEGGMIRGPSIHDRLRTMQVRGGHMVLD